MKFFSFFGKNLLNPHILIKIQQKKSRLELKTEAKNKNPKWGDYKKWIKERAMSSRSGAKMVGKIGGRREKVEVGNDRIMKSDEGVM